MIADQRCLQTLHPEFEKIEFASTKMTRVMQLYQIRSKQSLTSVVSFKDTLEEKKSFYKMTHDKMDTTTKITEKAHTDRQKKYTQK
jgi:hypothetical protein